MENISPEILGIIIRQLQDEATQPEVTQLNAWLDVSPQNKAAFEEVTRIWKLSDPTPVSFEVNTEAAWEKVKSKTISTKTQPAKVVRLSDYIWKVAAAVVVLAGIGYVFQNTFSHKETWTTVASASENRMVKLPDSSTVWLNKNSSLSYSDFEGEKREVKLSGEAFFEVTRNPEQPFQITGNESLTEVLGTSFNLKSRPGHPDVLEVVTGLVAFSPISNPGSVLKLKPGKTGEIISGKTVEERVTPDLNFRSWQTNQLSFDNTAMKQVCEELENHFGMVVEIKDSALLNCRFTGSFDKPELKEVLQVLSLSANLQVSQKDNSYMLSGNGCP